MGPRPARGPRRKVGACRPKHDARATLTLTTGCAIGIPNSTLSSDLNVRIMGYEDNKTRASCPVGGAAGTGRVPAPLPRLLQPLRGKGVAGALPDRAAH